MSRGNWYFAASVVGYLIAAAVLWAALRPDWPIIPTDEYQKAEQGEYSPGSPRCYPSRLSGLPEREAMDERYRCEQSAEEHRLKSDDLIQQTRAADAGVEMVALTYRQTLIALAGTLVGLLTLIAAFYAAWYSRRAADAAEGGLEHTQQVSNAELRPWVSIDLLLTGFEMDDDLLTVTYELRFENLGRSVASEFHYGTLMTILDDKPAEYIDRFFEKQVPPKNEARAVVLPGESVPGRGATMRATHLIPWATGPCPRVALIVVVATAFYKSPFDDEWHRTDRSFFIGQKDDQNILSGRLIREDLRTGDLERMRVIRARAGETT